MFVFSVSQYIWFVCVQPMIELELLFSCLITHLYPSVSKFLFVAWPIRLFTFLYDLFCFYHFIFSRPILFPLYMYLYIQVVKIEEHRFQNQTAQVHTLILPLLGRGTSLHVPISKMQSVRVYLYHIVALIEVCKDVPLTCSKCLISTTYDNDKEGTIPSLFKYSLSVINYIFVYIFFSIIISFFKKFPWMLLL